MLKIPFPGEWYAGKSPTERQGKMLIHFLHKFPERLEQQLIRLGYPKLISKFQVEMKPEIFTTNRRNVLAHMNDMRYSIEYSVAIARIFDKINLSDIEDALIGMLFSSKGSKDYKMPKEIIQKLADEL